MNKRTLSLVLALLMIFSIAMPTGIAFAESGNPDQQEATVQEDDSAEAVKSTEEVQTTETSDTQFSESGINVEQLETTVQEADSGSSAVSSQTESPTTETPDTKSPEQTESAPDTETGTVTEIKEFDENKPFTIARLEEIEGYSMEMDDASIPIENFALEGENENDTGVTCRLHFPEGTQTIHGGLIEANAPALVDNDQGQSHAYAYAHVGDTRVYYTGKLTIYNDGKTEDYIFYTTDKQITKRTVYAVLKANEKITLVYTHGLYHRVDYQFQSMDGTILPEDESSGWTYDKIFGEMRVRSIGDRMSFSNEINIPRGYTATIMVFLKNGTLKYSSELGKMMAYSWNVGNANVIVPDAKNSEAMKFTDSFSITDVDSDIAVTVKYKKVDTIHLNTYFWTQTVYAKNRIQIRDSSDIGSAGKTPNESNCKLDSNTHSFTWNFNGISFGNYTWEMNQLEINGEAIRVPMTTLTNTNPQTEKTILSTGTIVTLTVQSLGGNNGKTGKRAYTLQIDNCYEDLTISGGNMVGHIHREFAVHSLLGFEDSQYWYKSGTWNPLEQDTLIDKRNAGYDITDPFRFKLAGGYRNVHVSFTTKEGVVLQKDGTMQEGVSSPYIEYLIRTDTQDTENLNVRGTYTVVPYEQWTPSDDGYYYCRATNALDTYMKANSAQGVILTNFYADVIKGAIDYRNGAGDGETAPKAEHIEYMPGYQNGGNDGYNIRTNPTAIVSNSIPIDKDSNFIFDHWEILIVKDGELTADKKKDDNGNAVVIQPGQGIPVTTEILTRLNDCLYFHDEQQRETLTLQAVWKKRGANAPMPYSVRYILADLKNGNLENEREIEVHYHTVNEGSTLVSDLWQDGNKTLSTTIQEILNGDNIEQIDYRKEGNWVIYEPKTTKKIESVSADNNIAYIYLVKQPELILNKEVKGDLGDRTKLFEFTIRITDGNGNALTGSYQYQGNVLPDMGDRIVKPEDGALNFQDGSATIRLSHGQQVTFTNLPIGCTYTVSEGSEDGYTATYNGEKEPVTGKLESDTKITVVNTKGNIPDMGITDDISGFGILLGAGAMAVLLLLILAVWRRCRVGKHSYDKR